MNVMWIITVYSKGNNISMFEFNSEEEAREVFNNVLGCKILSEVIYFNDQVV
jgi:ArsR family metal-binding transcriptional regulator